VKKLSQNFLINNSNFTGIIVVLRILSQQLTKAHRLSTSALSNLKMDFDGFNWKLHYGTLPIAIATTNMTCNKEKLCFTSESNVSYHQAITISVSLLHNILDSLNIKTWLSVLA
jgi:hypothetical protein